MSLIFKTFQSYKHNDILKYCNCFGVIVKYNIYSKNCLFPLPVYSQRFQEYVIIVWRFKSATYSRRNCQKQCCMHSFALYIIQLIIEFVGNWWASANKSTLNNLYVQSRIICFDGHDFFLLFQCYRRVSLEKKIWT